MKDRKMENYYYDEKIKNIIQKNSMRWLLDLVDDIYQVLPENSHKVLSDEEKEHYDCLVYDEVQRFIQDSDFYIDY